MVCSIKYGKSHKNEEMEGSDTQLKDDDSVWVKSTSRLQSLIQWM